ncbi:sulfotransferase domain-containing protein [Antarctobacter heliothermus]|uniref:Sulfotransferase domain-containing protein n=1 Tax=Antarctobacter heliothermus TaxID=74033 RepID=A0A239JTN4_9RHOB|nr:sulfotransferase domain-containing protein [Antarctobacter heliothermus]SNT08753.1 Sulfotransferase domain-containing protein [Antarctobacter heliothermus]
MTRSHLPRYQGSLFDSARWSDVDLRPGDVVVSTPPKSGTTWTLAMAYLILHGADARFDRLSSVAPWIDFHGGKPDAPAPQAHAAHGRRLFKTHTPLDGLPLVDGVAVITVYRDPGDCLLSMRRHLSNMASPPPDNPNLGPLCKAFDTFLSRPLDHARFEGVTLSALLHHFRRSEPGSTVKVHYRDMSEAPIAALRTLSDGIGASLDQSSMRAILDRTKKAAMRNHSDAFAPQAKTGFFKDDAGFFSRQSNSAESLSHAQQAKLIGRVRTELDVRSAAWLCRTA